MDFVVAGFGIGALLIMIGFVIDEVGSVVRDENEPAGWRVVAPAVSRTATTAGGLVCVATLIALVFDVADRVGAAVVTVGSIAAVATIVIRGVLARRASARDLAPKRAAKPRRSSAAKPRPEAGWPAPRPLTSTPESALAPTSEPISALLPDLPAFELNGPGTPATAPPVMTSPHQAPRPIVARFQSPLLADIGVEPVDEAAPSFQSTLLADLASAESDAPSTEGYRSPLLTSAVDDAPVSSAAASGPLPIATGPAEVSGEPGGEVAPAAAATGEEPGVVGSTTNDPPRSL